MSYLAFKLLHLIGIFIVLMGLGAQIALSGHRERSAVHKLAGLCHGLGLLIVLFGGFGLLVSLMVPWPWPGWLLAKLLIWLLIGSLLVFVRRNSALAHLWWWGVVALSAAAGYLALFKPF